MTELNRREAEGDYVSREEGIETSTRADLAQSVRDYVELMR